MIVPLKVNLEGATAERFLSLARCLARDPPKTESSRQELVRSELIWLEQNESTNSQKAAFEATVRVLIDLERMGWKVRESGYGIELNATPPKIGGLSPTEIRDEKQKTRAMFLPSVEAQFNDLAIQKFIKRMEEPWSKSGKKSICKLIVDGAEVYSRLCAYKKGLNEKDEQLEAPFSPYLQLASTDNIDNFTGHSLRDIWRYFRFTWSIPQYPTPGRQLLYLIRDAAHPCHPIMGIIGLNSVVGLVCRELLLVGGVPRIMHP
jgi:hypothetical protein